MVARAVARSTARSPPPPPPAVHKHGPSVRNGPTGTPHLDKPVPACDDRSQAQCGLSTVRDPLALVQKWGVL